MAASELTEFVLLYSMMKYDVRGCISTFGIVIFCTANTSSLIFLSIPAAVANFQSVSNIDNNFEKTTTAPSVSEPFPIILNEPSFLSKTAGPEAIQFLDIDPSEKDLLVSTDFDDSSTKHVEKLHLSDGESSVVYDYLQVENSSATPDKSSKDRVKISHPESASHAKYLEAESTSIPNVNVVDFGMQYPSLLPKVKVPEQCDHHRHDLDREVSRVTTIDEDFDDRSLLDVFGEAAKEYLTQKVVRFCFIVMFQFLNRSYPSCPSFDLLPHCCRFL
jgi:hypothetical protein